MSASPAFSCISRNGVNSNTCMLQAPPQTGLSAQRQGRYRNVGSSAQQASCCEDSPQQEGSAQKNMQRPSLWHLSAAAGAAACQESALLELPENAAPGCLQNDLPSPRPASPPATDQSPQRQWCLLRKLRKPSQRPSSIMYCTESHSMPA